MTAEEWYRARLAEWQSRKAEASHRSLVLSRARVAIFLGAAAVIGWGGTHGQGWFEVAGVAGFIAFGWLAAVHARVLGTLERCDAARLHHERALARLTRDWAQLPEVGPPAGFEPDAHPYAIDLDLAGRASLAAWLGQPATTDGRGHLWRWLLSPDELSAVAARQLAVEDLGPRRAWRESFVIEGALLRVSSTDLAAFLNWAESSASAVSRLAQVLAPILAVAIWILLVPFVRVAYVTYPFPAAHGLDPNALMSQWIAGLPTPWWLIPLAFGIVLSRISERPIHASFDRAAFGERALPRVSTMLALVCDERWTSSIPEALQGRIRTNGDAPSTIRTLARRSQWSELWRAAPLLYFPIQALTLWDFHVLFLIERWRGQHGRKVRGWLDALGEFDALAVLSRVRADEPLWVMPVIDPTAPSLEATAVGHPLIPADRRVANDVSVGPRGSILLVTGSNMSGKSTLLRAVGLNAVLAQAGAPVCAKAFRMPPVDIYTSIRIQDSLERGLSYFMASLARLKTIVDAADRATAGRLLLYLLDELLQGTNSAERGIAVLAVVRHLLDANAIGMMTTHDLALAGQPPLSTVGRLVHFTEQVQPDGGMTFDYTLRPGLATSTNALRLMQLIGIRPR